MKNFISKLRNSKHSTLLFVLMFICLIVLIIGSFIGAVYLVGNIAGFASIAFLVIGVIIFGVFSKYPQQNSSVVLAFLIVLFTATGGAVDQAGNYIYNLPVEYIMCPDGTELDRNVYVRRPLPERTEFVQEFNCVDEEMNVVEEINLVGILGIRFIEYLILAFLLLAARSLFYKLNLFGRNRELQIFISMNSVIIQLYTFNYIVNQNPKSYILCSLNQKITNTCHSISEIMLLNLL